MTPQQRVLLLVGSAKRPRSTSESLGNYLLERLGNRGFATQKLFLYRAMGSADGCKALLAEVDHADILILAFPLFVDSLPALVIRTLEAIAQHRQTDGNLRKARVLAIVNSGFPEAHQNDTALAICRRFAKEVGFDWAGGLALGGGETIDGQSLTSVKLLARNVIRALDLTADSLARRETAPQEAVSLMAKPLLPTWLYILLGEIRWRWRSRKHHVEHQLDARPYEGAHV